MRAFSLIVVLFSSLFMILPAAAEPVDVPKAAVSQLVDINTATAKQMAKQLNGIGKNKAEAIVAYRNTHGPFKTVEELSKVQGVGKKTVEANKGLISVGEVQ